MEKKILETCFDGLNVLILGDVILDHYLIGKVDRISPEAPVPVVVHQEEDYRLGGAANVALNIKAMGATPHLVAVIGDDLYGQRLLDLMVELELNTNALVVEKTRKTTCKTRILAKNQQLLRYDHEVTEAISCTIQQKVEAQVLKLIQQKNIDVIVFQDYNKGLLTDNLIATVLKLAQERNIKTLADPKKSNFWAYKGVDWFKPNLREINEGLNITISEKTPQKEALLEATQQVQQQLGNTHTLITLGAKGMYYAGPEGALLEPTQERQIADVCGAGDTVISIIALGVAAHLQTKEMLTLANIAGGQVCEKVGVVSIHKQDLLDEYFQH